MHVLREQFEIEFGHTAEVISRAPGRVEFIGNHTDYNGGSVIGVAIDRYVSVAAAMNRNGCFRIRSTSGAENVMLMSAPETKLRDASAWANYVLRVWRAMGDFGLARPPGFDLLVDADLPAGAGLSSSAALEMATALALLHLAGAPELEPERLAALCHHAENKSVSSHGPPRRPENNLLLPS